MEQNRITFDALSHRRSWLALGLVCCTLFLVRVLPMYREPGGEDEDCYAVPGLTILQSGIPRLPHVPARNPESVYYRADEALFSEPPLYFYCQAAAYACLPDVYGTARLVSLLAAIGVLILLDRIGHGWGIERRWVLLSLLAFSFSRWFFFPATHARPDMLCTLLGMATILTMQRWERTRSQSTAAVAGLWIGIGGLSHPFAMVYAIQAAIWAGIRERGWKRLTTPLLMAGVSLVVCCLWLPLIARYPDAFLVQFRNQFLHGTGGSTLQRLFLPGESLAYHTGLFWRHIGPWQTLHALAVLVLCLAWVSNLRGARWPGLIGLSGAYLTAVLVGPHHTVHGYWTFSLGFVFLGMAQLLTEIQERLHIDFRFRWVPWVLGCLVCLSMLPGTGLKTVLVHLREWQNVDYNAPAFAQRMLRELPADAVYAVDTQFTLDFFVAGRRTLYCQTQPLYFRLEQFDFDYLVLSRYGFDAAMEDRFPGPVVYRAGSKEDRFACFAEVYAADHRHDEAPSSDRARHPRSESLDPRP